MARSAVAPNAATVNEVPTSYSSQPLPSRESPVGGSSGLEERFETFLPEVFSSAARRSVVKLPSSLSFMGWN